MTTETDIYLTDEFITFSEGIKNVHNSKKAKQEEIKKLFDEAKAEMKLMDEEAASLKAGWDSFVANFPAKKDKK